MERKTGIINIERGLCIISIVFNAGPKIGAGTIRIEYDRKTEEWLVWIRFDGETGWQSCCSLSNLDSSLIPEIHPGVNPEVFLMNIIERVN